MWSAFLSHGSLLIYAQLLVAFSVVLGVGFSLVSVFPKHQATPRSYPYGGLATELGGNPARAEEENDDDE
jgi:hypothetical protein